MLHPNPEWIEIELSVSFIQFVGGVEAEGPCTFLFSCFSCAAQCVFRTIVVILGLLANSSTFSHSTFSTTSSKVYQ